VARDKADEVLLPFDSFFDLVVEEGEEIGELYTTEFRIIDNDFFEGLLFQMRDGFFLENSINSLNAYLEN